VAEAVAAALGVNTKPPFSSTIGGRCRQSLDGFDCGNTFDLGIVWIDEMNRLVESTVAKTLQDIAAGRAFARTGAKESIERGSKSLPMR
jgi:hypothetical protein